MYAVVDMYVCHIQERQWKVHTPCPVFLFQDWLTAELIGDCSPESS